MIEILQRKARRKRKINCLSIIFCSLELFLEFQSISLKCRGIDRTICKLIEGALKFNVEHVSTGSSLFITQPLQGTLGI